MILMRKPCAPARLRVGIDRTARDCTAHKAGTREFKFDKTIYGHKTVKNVLIKAQHAKCCFCEGRFNAHAYGDVEHYRPKSSVRQDKDFKPLYPGYYWLAYSWENLYYACGICNSRKGSFFPLLNPAKRARSHADNLADEMPLILDPGGPEDPRNHIKFRGNLASDVTKAGRTTIEVIDLNRPELTEERLIYLKELSHLLDITHVFAGNTERKAAEILKNAQRKLDAAVEPTAKFSSMAADFLHRTEPAQVKAP